MNHLFSEIVLIVAIIFHHQGWNFTTDCLVGFLTGLVLFCSWINKKFSDFTLQALHCFVSPSYRWILSCHNFYYCFMHPFSKNFYTIDLDIYFVHAKVKRGQFKLQQQIIKHFHIWFKFVPKFAPTIENIAGFLNGHWTLAH